MTGAKVRSRVAVYLEVGRRRVFAGAIEWPGWCRSGRDENLAIHALVAYAPRYAAAVRRAAPEFNAPADASALEVVERLDGNATTDFGAPATAPSSDERPLDDIELGRLTELLKASWAAFDVAAKAASSAVLRKGPRGGGRELDAIISHLLESDAGYLRQIGGKYRAAGSTDVATDMAGVRKAILDRLSSVPSDGVPPGPRGGIRWTPRYFIRRSAWHALDHAWEIEDRAATGPSGAPLG